MNEPKEEKIFLCSCGTEGLIVHGLQWEDTPIEIEIAFWKYAHDVSYTLKEKLRAIKYILKKGHPYVDMVGMDVETAKRFVNAILEACENPEKE
jgi:hypothetical protein